VEPSLSQRSPLDTACCNYLAMSQAIGPFQRSPNEPYATSTKFVLQTKQLQGAGKPKGIAKGNKGGRLTRVEIARRFLHTSVDTMRSTLAKKRLSKAHCREERRS